MPVTSITPQQFLDSPRKDALSPEKVADLKAALEKKR